MKIVFFGTPDFAARHLEALHQAGLEIVAIVTKPDKPVGRSLKIQPVPVKVMAEKLMPQVPLFQPEKCSTPEFIEILKKYPADLFAVVAYGEIIKQAVIDLPKFGCINVHASLLPAYRGAAPMQRCLMDGQKETGISIIQLILKMDAGDVLHYEKVAIAENMTFPE
ncbi:MAG TPA: methionyl-tRNA formyltransferase, partial [Chlamydiales bacterium]|nr:methionyl-tRNA formyltransferase [Chlamydiales bacterium]